MTKKEYLKKLLSVLPDQVFLPRQDLLYLLDHDVLTPEILDVLFAIFSSYVHDVNDQVLKGKLEESMKFIKKLQSIEEQDKLNDQKDIEELDSMLANM